eukprot:6868892-Pyramimonas_sp.AAC.1
MVEKRVPGILPRIAPRPPWGVKMFFLTLLEAYQSSLLGKKPSCSAQSTSSTVATPPHAEKLPHTLIVSILLLHQARCEQSAHA